MGNNYFQFKQFRIEQDKCSMKVCTDACIFGAWVASKFSHNSPGSVLDIGAGTGLLSLMLAQKTQSIINALEIEKNAFEQCNQNFKNSPWKEKLNVLNTDAKDFFEAKKYDLIFSNPPFFHNDLISTNKNKNVAKHSEALNLETLLSVVIKNLSDEGFFSVLLPFHRIEYFTTLAQQYSFHLNEKVLIKQTQSHRFFRGILLFSRSDESWNTSELIIKTDGFYTASFVHLLKDYYLDL